MSENVSEASLEETSFFESSRGAKSIIIGGLTVGVLDCLAATINSAINGVTFTQVWQYVASGLLGRASYQHGWKTVLLGLAIHFLIAFSVAAVYYLASLRLPILIRHAVVFGALYGVAVYFFMGKVIAPLSAAAKLSFSLSSMITGILIHIFCVGLPAALIVRWYARDRQKLD